MIHETVIEEPAMLIAEMGCEVGISSVAVLAVAVTAEVTKTQFLVTIPNSAVMVVVTATAVITLRYAVEAVMAVTAAVKKPRHQVLVIGNPVLTLVNLMAFRDPTSLVLRSPKPAVILVLVKILEIPVLLCQVLVVAILVSMVSYQGLLVLLAPPMALLVSTC